MPYSNLTFQVQPNLGFKTHDFVYLSGTEILTTSTTTSTTTICAQYINSIVISNGSYTAANGTYIRSNPIDAFSLVGGSGAIFYSVGDAWYIFNTAVGNVARNTSELGTGTWEAWPVGNSTGITAVYSSYVCPTTTSTTTTTTTL